MQANSPKLNLSVHLGQDTGQSTLAQIDVCNHIGNAQINQLKQRAKLGGEQLGQHLVCLIRYFVYPGREAEALKYLQEGFDQSIAKDLMSPLQFITRKVEEEEMQSSIYSQTGAVCVRYKFSLDEEMSQIAEKVEKFEHLRVQLQLKGFVSHTHKNRTNVKVDYAYVNLRADEMPDPDLLNNFMVEGDLIPQEVLQNPFYAGASKTRKMHLALRFKNFRQINKYYEEMADHVGYNYKKKEDKTGFRYVAPGLFRQNVEAFAFLRDSVAVSANITHQGEDIFLRLIKVYFKAAKKALGQL